MRGWIVPSPREPQKSEQELERERVAKVAQLGRQGYLKSERIRHALLKIPRQAFIPRHYRDYAYEEVPLPLPGRRSTLSCPHSYPLFYEPLGLDRGHRFLEVGTGSGYGAAVAREVVGVEGIVVSIELDPVTHQFAKDNLERAGYDDVVLVLGDGRLGYPPLSPYDRIAVTAASPQIPAALIEQLRMGGKAIGPIERGRVQILILHEKGEKGIRQQEIVEVLYMPLRGDQDA